MHRLLDNASNSLVAVLAFAGKLGVVLDGQRNAMFVLNSMLRDEAGKRFVDGVWNGKHAPIDVDHLDLVNAARLAYADQLGVSEQAVIRFEKAKVDANGCGPQVRVHCNHPGCSMSKIDVFKTPVEMIEAEHRASKEIWYCHHHREVAFSNEGAISDELLSALQRIAQSPGLTQKATGVKKEELAFLGAVGLVRIDQVRLGNRVICYQIFITEAGASLLQRTILDQP